jgi:thymidylate synthase (FAD)
MRTFRAIYVADSMWNTLSQPGGELRVITEPTVTLLAWPQFQEHPKYKLPSHEAIVGVHGKPLEGATPLRLIEGTDSEQLIAHAGKGCYDSYGEDGRAISEHITTLVDSGHGSVLEHANVSVFIEGISRACSHEIVRHRAGMAYSQRSTRYTAEDDAAIVLNPYFAGLFKKYNLVYEPIPDVIDLMPRWWHKDGSVYDIPGYRKEEHSALLTKLHAWEYAMNSYTSLIKDLTVLAPEHLTKTEKRKWARGNARQVTPHMLETRMTMTGNLRAWWHFLVARSNRHAEAEIRRLADKIATVILPLAPYVFIDFSDAEVVDGFREFTPLQTKV